MKKFLVALLMAIAAACAPPPASAQSLTPGCSSPPPFYGVVWTASQWIVCLSSLQAQLGYTPLNIAGGSMSGELFLQPSVTTNAPLNFPPGSAPTSPANGDFWFTSAGAFYRAGGVSIGPLASTSSPTLNNPTFTGTVTLPSGATFTSAGGQGFAHLYVNRTTDVGGAQVLQVQGNGYMSGGLSIGSTQATSGGIAIASAISWNLANSIALDFNTNGRFQIWGPNASSYSGFQLVQLHSDGTGGRSPFTVDTSGNAQFTGTTSLGTGSADYVNVSGGGSGGTITTNAGTLTVGSAGGTTNLADATVHFNNGTYASCGVLGTSSGNVVCSSPASFITYNDNVTTSTLAVSANEYCMNTGSGALTLTLPASPSNGAYVAFSDCGGNFGVNNLTIAGNGSNIMYDSGNMTVSTPYAAGVLRYDLGKTSWILQAL